MTTNNAFRFVGVLGFAVLASACAGHRFSSVQSSAEKNISISKARESPPELIGTVPSSGHTLPNEDRRCSKNFIISASPPSYQNRYRGLRFVVTQEGKPNSNIRFNIVEENSRFWWDEVLYEGVKGQLWVSPIPWNKNLYFSDPTGTGGRDFAVVLYLSPVKGAVPVSMGRQSIGKVICKVQGK